MFFMKGSTVYHLGNPIFDTDFASLVRYDRFPSLLYGSGATFLNTCLWYGDAARSFIAIFSNIYIYIYIYQLGNQLKWGQMPGTVFSLF